jgi:hypothetical protein
MGLVYSILQTLKLRGHSTMPFYLHLSKIKGSCTDPKHAGWIRLDGYRFAAWQFPQVMNGQRLCNQILHINVPRSELGYLQLAQAVVKGTDVGPGLLHDVPVPNPESQLARLMLNPINQPFEFKIGKSIFVIPAQTLHPRISVVGIPSTSSWSFELAFTSSSKLPLPG